MLMLPLAFPRRVADIADVKNITQHNLDARLETHFKMGCTDDSIMRMKQEFHMQGCTVIQNLLPRDLFDAYSAELEQTFAEHGVLHSIQNQLTQTRRVYQKLPYSVLLEHSRLSQMLYHSIALHRMVSSIIDAEVKPLEICYKDDRFVAHRLHPGGEHGAHVDPKMLALVLMMKVVPEGMGGSVNIWRIPKEAPPALPGNIKELTEKYADTKMTVHPAQNSASLMLAGAYPHEVTRNNSSTIRENVTFSYDAGPPYEKDEELARKTYEEEVLPTA